MMSLTKGGLVPAKLSIVGSSSPDDTVNFMFNPFEYSLTKANSWNRDTGKGTNVPVTTFMQGGPMQLKLTLHFDTFTEGTDVRKHTNKLWKMMMLDQTTENQHSNKGTPPAVAFDWGKLYFKAVMTSMTQKFTLFNAEGMPVRCQVDVSLEQHMDDTNKPPQNGSYDKVAATAILPSLGLKGMLAMAAASAVAAVAIAAASDRMDHVAKKTTGDSNNMRKVAERNNVDNPLKIRSGQSFS